MHFLFPSETKPQNALQKLICLFSDNNGGILETVKASPLSTPSLEPRSRNRKKGELKPRRLGNKILTARKRKHFWVKQLWQRVNMVKEEVYTPRKRGFVSSVRPREWGSPKGNTEREPSSQVLLLFFVSCIFLCSFHSASTSTYLYVCVFSIMW